MQLSKRRDAAKPLHSKVVRLAMLRNLAVSSVNRLIVLSAFGRVSERPDAWVSTRCAIPGDSLLQSPNSCSRRPALPKLELPLTPFLGTEDTALSCFPVQDLVKKMLDKNEARL